MTYVISCQISITLPTSALTPNLPSVLPSQAIFHLRREESQLVNHVVHGVHQIKNFSRNRHPHDLLSQVSASDSRLWKRGILDYCLEKVSYIP